MLLTVPRRSEMESDYKEKQEKAYPASGGPSIFLASARRVEKVTCKLQSDIQCTVY